MTGLNYKLLGCSAVLLGFSNFAYALDCHDGDLVAVRGSVATWNISDVNQKGIVKLKLIERGEVEYKNAGKIFGTVVSQAGVTSKLDHNITFSSRNNDSDEEHEHDDSGDVDSINTKGDHATLLMPPLKYEADGTACAFNVVESITQFVGTGVFEGATGYIIAEGKIQFCMEDILDPAPDNTFILSGKVCLKD